MRTIATCCVCLLGLVACGPGSLEGSVGDHTIKLQSAIFASYIMTAELVSTGQEVRGPAVVALLSDDPNACGSVSGKTAFHPAHTYLFMHLNQQYYTQQDVGTVPEVAAGYYSAQNPASFDPTKQGGTAIFYFKPPGCQSNSAAADPSAYGLDGGILVNDITPSKGGTATGDIDVKVGAHGDSLKGTVHLAYCSPLETFLKQDLAWDPGAWDCQ